MNLNFYGAKNFALKIKFEKKTEDNIIFNLPL